MRLLRLRVTLFFLDRQRHRAHNRWVRSCLVLLLLPLVLLSSCVPRGPEGRVVTYTSVWTKNEPQARYMEAMARDFEAETGVRVAIQFLGRDVLTKIHARVLMGDPPDLVDQDFIELTAALLAPGQIQARPLDDFFFKTPGPEGQPRMLDLFRQDLVKLYASGGHLYFYPYEFISSGFFYSRTLFARAGVTAPRTWDEFLAVHRILAAKGIAPLALDGNINFYNATYYLAALDRVAGPGALRRASFDRTGATWKEPAYLEAARMVAELAAERLFQPGYASVQWPAAQSDWARGRAGSLLCGTWIPSETEALRAPDFAVGFYPFPSVAGGRGNQTALEAMFFGFAVPAEAKNPADALAFLRFLGRKENTEALTQMTGNISPRQDTPYPPALADLRPLVDGARSFRLPYDGAMQTNPAWFAKVFYPLDNALIFGRIAPATFVAQLADQTRAYWQDRP